MRTRAAKPSTLALAAGLALASCSVSSPPEGAIGRSPTARPASTGARQPDPSQTRSGDPRPGETTAPGATTSPIGVDAEYADTGPVGAMAASYLRRSPARRLVVEVDWVRGRAPRESALRHLRTLLEREADKPDGVVLERDDEIQAARSSYRTADIEALERAHRDRRSTGATATMWIVYLNGTFAGASGALGVAYSGSAFAIFDDQIESATTALVLAAAIEKAVVAHELGHLLGLVNLAFQSPREREDPDHPHHSRNRDSVMFWAIEDVSIASILDGGPPDDFDADDRADLRFLRGA